MYSAIMAGTVQHLISNAHWQSESVFLEMHFCLSEVSRHFVLVLLHPCIQ